MKLLVLAVGQRQPALAEEAWADFAKRFPPEMRLEPKALKAELRSGGKTAAQCMTAEAQRFEAALLYSAKGSRRVVLDESGTRRTTAQLAERLQALRGEGRGVALLIGGPDGLDPALSASADETLRLRDLTLPHAFACVLLAEALYRAKAPGALDLTNKTVRKGSATEALERLVNRAKSRVRARVEHVFGVVKRLWGFDKARYRGLAKNATRAFVATALANIFLARKRLVA
jgi:23S rRNA (pseudouridine1915-N3)-methyltransferase